MRRSLVTARRLKFQLHILQSSWIECGFVTHRDRCICFKAVTCEGSRSKLLTVSVRGWSERQRACFRPPGTSESLWFAPQCHCCFCQQSPPQTTAIYNTSLLPTGALFSALNSASERPCTCVSACAHTQCMSERLCAIEPPINYAKGKSGATFDRGLSWSPVCVRCKHTGVRHIMEMCSVETLTHTPETWWWRWWHPSGRENPFPLRHTHIVLHPVVWLLKTVCATAPKPGI